MALTLEERAFLKQVYKDLDPNKPLEPTSPFYQPLYELEGCDDPVDLLQRIIEFSDGESLQFFSGFRGSGKSTELLRLKQCLESDGHIVFYSDVLEYINPAQPIDITDLLIYLNTTEVNVDELKLTAVKELSSR